MSWNTFNLQTTRSVMKQKKRKGYIPEEILNERHDPKAFDEAMNRLLHVDKRKQEYKRIMDKYKKGKN